MIDELSVRYAGVARHVATPGEGTTLSAGSYNRLTMNGKEVYKFATREVPKVIVEALEAANMQVEQVDWLLLHQVSCMITKLCVVDVSISMFVSNYLLL